MSPVELKIELVLILIILICTIFKFGGEIMGTFLSVVDFYCIKTLPVTVPITKVSHVILILIDL